MKNLFRLVVLFSCLLGLSSFAQALSISSVTPGTTSSPGTLNVPVTSGVVVTFDKTVKWSTILNNNTYRITLNESVSGNSVAVTYSPTSNSSSYTLTPKSNLKANTIYKISISKKIAVSNWEDLGTNYTYYFKTVASTDVTPPTVSPIYPASGATNIPVDSSISALFSEDMDATTVESPAASITLSPAVTGTISYDTKEATFQPSANLSPGTTYTVTVHNTVKDVNGNTMVSNYSWSFTTVNPDSTPPQVLSTNPVTGATGVSVTPTLQIVFNEPILTSSITAANFTVSGGSWAAPSFDGDRTVTLTLSSGSLNYATDYTVTVSTGVKDLAGNSMSSAYLLKFTTVQNLTPPNVIEYAQVPPFVAGTGVKPNLLLVVDNSGSMEEFAYKTAGKGNSTGSGSDASYNSSTLYYGYFDNTKMYKYNSSGYFELDTTKTLDKTNFWSGNMLNWLTMRRVDVVRKVLVGGRVVQGSNSNPVNPRVTTSTNNYLVGLADTSRDYYKLYSGVYYKVMDGPLLKVCSSSSCSSYTQSYNIKVLYGTQPPTDGLVTQYADRIRIGTMFFNTDGTYYEDANSGDEDGGYIASNVGSTKETITYQIETTNPSSWTPLAESLYEAVRYFEARPSAYNSSVDYSSSDPVTQSCQRNFVMIVTDGESTKDQNLPSSAFNGDGSVSKVTDPYSFNVQTWMDSIAANEGITSQKATAANSSEGTYYLEGVAYYAHNTDLRTASVGKSNIDGKQNLTIYTVFAFDDSSVGRELLKRTAKYGGYEDLDNNGKPYTDSTCGTASPNSKCSEWDKNGDGIPDTYFEAQQGQQLVTALSQAFNDILSRVSSGTAASILNNSEGSGASLLQAVFYPKKTFDAGSEATWVGELQNMWYYLDPYLNFTSIRVDTVANNKLNLLEDYVAQFYFDSSSSQTLVRLLRDTKGDGTVLADLGSFNPDDTTNVKSLWRAGRMLWARNLTTDARKIYTRIGGSTDSTLDSVLNAASEATHLAEFATALKTDSTVLTYLQAANATEAEKIINFIKGTDQSGYRSRAATIAGTAGTWRLGDIISSTPKVQGNVGLNAYSQNPPVGYADSSYEKFTKSNDYGNRGMAYVGANDGMLHAFRLGVLKELTDPCRNLESDSNSTSCKADKAKLNDYTKVASGTTIGANANIRADAADAIGKEEWAFIPRQVLPYLKYLADTAYPHLFYVDGTPLIVDVSINKPTTYDTVAYPGCSTNYWECPKQTQYNSGTQNLDVANTSWKTVLIGGSGLGGASRSRAGSCAGGGTDCIKTPIVDPTDSTAAPNTRGFGYSSYFALDVTDPMQPKYLWEFPGNTTAANNLGHATAGPVIMRVGDKNKNGRWFAVFASGPTGTIDTVNNQFLGRSDQPLRLFVVDLATGALVKTITTTLTDAFAGSASNAAVDNDRSYSFKDGFYKDDAAYFGYVQKVDATHWSKGGVIRLATNESVDPNDGSKPWTWSSVISGIGPVSAAVAKLQDRANGKLWLYFGTGRYFYKNSTEIDDSGSSRRLYAVQDPCYDAATNKILPSCTTTVAATDLDDQTTSPSATLAASKKGWYINLDDDSLGDGYSSERVITDPVASTSGTVFYTTFRPTSDVCGYGGNSYIWALNYATGGAPAPNTMKGKIMVQVSTGAFAEVSMSAGFTDKENRRSGAIQGVPPKAQGLSLLTNPKPVKKIIHIQEK
ncbi:Ig-like domain-containing protein [Trichlorobacter lovleyi]|uniref:Ig-like domain-containing protein n=1 Tax=Trichlorobacter lovleyi TaxID=313985 RepID=UPI00223F4E48|nr:Ig-like domain-containing protein [Trichlorobacter lovleyi]QOX79208.1 Ig-like domain-containing protein [Trichlorobacter lovleyi]